MRGTGDGFRGSTYDDMPAVRRSSYELIKDQVVV